MNEIQFPQNLNFIFLGAFCAIVVISTVVYLLFWKLLLKFHFIAKESFFLICQNVYIWSFLFSSLIVGGSYGGSIYLEEEIEPNLMKYYFIFFLLFNSCFFTTFILHECLKYRLKNKDSMLLENI